MIEEAAGEFSAFNISPSLSTQSQNSVTVAASLEVYFQWFLV